MALLVLHGDSGEEQRFALSKPVVFLGRSRECDVSLQGSRVSRKHARLDQANHGYVLVDLESTHGTKVNGSKVESEVALSDGDIILLGDVTLSFHATEASAQAAASPLAATINGIDDETPSAKIVTSLDASTQMHLRASVRTEEKLNAIVSISKELAENLAPDRVLERILETTLTIFPAADHAYAVLYSPTSALNATPSQQILTVLARHRKKLQSRPPPPSRTILQEAMKTGRAFMCQDLDNSLFKNSDSLAGATIRAVLCSPMVTQEGAILGAIQITGNQVREQFEQSDLDVLVSVTSMAALAIQSARHHEVALQRQAFEQDLEFARKIQTNFLPRHEPKVPGYAFSQYCQPAQEIGGDYFDYIPLPGGSWAIVIADVSGKGFPAALYMARFSAEIRAALLYQGGPADVLHHLSQAIFEIKEGNTFITCALALLDPGSHRLQLGLAGHPPPLFVHDGRLQEWPHAGGLPLGLFDRQSAPMPYQIEEIELAPGDTLLFYTDGISEALDPQGRQYGTGRLEQVLSASRRPVRDITTWALQDVERFRGDRPPLDDTTLVGLQRL